MHERIATVIRALEERPGERKAFVALREELVQAGDWQGLEALFVGASTALVGEAVDIWDMAGKAIRASLDNVPDLSHRAAGWEALGRLRHDRLDERHTAAGAFAEAWALDRSRQVARARAESLVASEGFLDVEVRLLEIRASLEDSTRERVRLLRRAALRASEGLKDDARARRLQEDADALELSLSQAPTIPPGVGVGDGEADEPTVPLELEASTGLRPAAGSVPVDDVRSLRSALTASEDPSALRERVAAVVEASPHDPEVLQVHALLLEKLGDLVGAAEQLEQALRRDPQGLHAVAILERLGRIHWSGRGDAAAAERVFARLRRVQPRNAEMLRFFAERMESGRDWRRLYSTLVALRDVTDEPQEQLALTERLAELAERRLESPDRAVEAWKWQASRPVGASRAREELQRLLRETGRWNALQEVYRESVAALADDAVDEKVEILLTMAEIHREQLGMRNLADQVYATILELDPGHAVATAALAERYESTGRWTDLARVLAERASREGEPEEQAQLWRRVAAIRQDHMSDAEGAAQALECLLGLMPDDVEALERLHAIRLAQGDQAGLLRVEERQLLHLPTPERVARLLDMAHRAEESLRDIDLAVTFLTRVLEALPEHETADANLERLMRERGDRHALIRYLRGRLLRREAFDAGVAEELAGLLDEADPDSEEGESLWRELLVHDPEHQRAADALFARWFRRAEWGEIETLAREQGRLREVVESWLGASVDDRVGLLERALRVAADDLEDVALERRVVEALLGERPDDRAWLGRLEHLLTRLDAPPEERFEVLQRLLATATEADERWARYGELADFCMETLRDPAQAWRWMAELVESRPEDAALREKAGTIAAAAGEGRALFQLMKRVAASLGRTGARVDLHRWLAAYALDVLDAREEAVGFLERVLEAEPGDAQTISSLQMLYHQAEDWPALRRLLDAEAAHGDDAVAWPAALFAAEITLRELGDVEETQSRVSDLEARFGDRPEVRRLGRALAEHLGDVDGVLETLERELADASDPTAREALVLELSGVQLREKRGIEEALSRLVELQDSPALRTEAGVLADAVRACRGESGWGREAAAVLVRLARLSDDPDRLVGALDLVLRDGEVGPESVAAREALVLERAEAVAHRMELPGAALDGLLEAVAEADWSEAFWGRVWALAEEQDRSADALEGLGVAAEAIDSVAVWRRLAQERSARGAETEAVVAAWRRVLERAPMDVEALLALEALMTQAEADGLLVDVLVRLSGVPEGSEQRFDRLLRAARVAGIGLGDLERAEAILGSALEERPGAPQGLQVAEEVLGRDGGWERLLSLLSSQREVVGAEARPGLELRMAALREDALGDPVGALAQRLALAEEHPELADDLTRLQRQAERVGDSDAQRRVIGLRLSRGGTPEERAALHLQRAELFLDDDLVEEAAADGLASLEAVSGWGDAVELLWLLWHRLRADSERADTVGRALEEALRSAGDHARLSEILRSRIASGGLDPRAGWEELAALYAGPLAQPQGALAAWHEIFRLDPSREDALAALVELSRQTGSHEVLAEGLDEALAWTTLDGALRARLLVERARLAELDGDVSGALAWVDEARLVAPESLDVVSSGIRVLEKLGEHERLVDLLERSAELSSERAVRVRQLGSAARVALLRLRDRNRAVALLQSAFASDPGDEVVLGLLLSLLEAEDRWEEVAALLQTRCSALEGTPGWAASAVALSRIYRRHLGDRVAAWDVVRTVRAGGPVGDALLAELLSLHAGAVAAGQPLADEIFARFEVLASDRPDLLLRLARQHLLGGRDGRWVGEAGVVERAWERVEAARDGVLVREVVRRGVVCSGGAEQWVARALAVCDGLESRRTVSAALMEVAHRESNAREDRLRCVLAVKTLTEGEASLHGLLREAATVGVGIAPDDPRIEALETALLRSDESPELLIELLTRRLDAADDPDRRQRLTLELAQAQLGALQDAGRAADTLSAWLLECPDDPEAMRLLAACLRELEDWDRLCAHLEGMADGLPPGEERTALRLELASLREHELDDVEGALLVLRMAMDDDPEDLGVWEHLVDALERQGRGQEALGVVDARLVRESSGQGNHSGTAGLRGARLADTLDSGVDEVARRAVAALNAGASAAAVEELLAGFLEEGAISPEILAGAVGAANLGESRRLRGAVLEAAVASATSPETEVRALAGLGEFLAEEDDTREDALDPLGQAVMLSGGDPVLVERLIGLGCALGAEERCIRLLEEARSSVDDGAASTHLALRLAEFCLDVGGYDEDALAAIDGLDPAAEPGVARVLERMRGVPSLRRVVTGKLEPVFRQRGDSSGVVDALEARLASEDDAERRAAILLELSAEEADSARAFEYACAAFRAWPTSKTLSRAEELLPSDDGGLGLALMVQEALDDASVSPVEGATWLVRAAGRSLDRAGDADLALELLEQAAALDPEAALSGEMLRAVDAGAVIPPERHAELLGAAAADVDDTAERHGLWLEQAALLAEEGRDPDAALRIARQVLDEDSGDKVAGALFERVASETGRWDALLDLLEERLDQTGDAQERRRLHQRIVGILRDELADRERLIAALRALVAAFPDEVSAWEDLQECLSSGDPLEFQQVLTDRLGHTKDTEQQVALLMQLGQVAERRLDDPGRAVAWYRQALGKPEGRLRAAERLTSLYREIEDWAALAEVLAELGSDDPQHALEAAEVMLRRLGDDRGATEILERLLAAAPGDAAAGALLAWSQQRRGDRLAARQTVSRLVAAGVARPVLTEALRKRDPALVELVPED